MGGNERSLARESSTSATEGDYVKCRESEQTPAPHAWRPARFMVIVAHPDDADFGPAATAAAWIDEGSEGWLVCCTSGDAGARRLADRPHRAGRRPRGGAAGGGTHRRLRGRSRSCTSPTAPWPTTSRCASSWSGRSARSVRMPSCASTPRRCSTGTAASTTPTTARPGSPRSTPSTPRPATRWRSRGSPATAWRRTSSAACTCSGRTSRPPGSTSPRPSTASSRPCAPTRARSATRSSSSRGSGAGHARRAQPIGVEAAEAFRVIVIDEDDEERARPTDAAETEARRPADAADPPGLSGASSAGRDPRPRRPRGRRAPPPARRARPPIRPSDEVVGLRRPATRRRATIAPSYSAASSASRGQVRIRIRSRPA